MSDEILSAIIGVILGGIITYPMGLRQAKKSIASQERFSLYKEMLTKLGEMPTNPHELDMEKRFNDVTDYFNRHRFLIETFASKEVQVCSYSYLNLATATSSDGGWAGSGQRRIQLTEELIKQIQKEMTFKS